MKILFAAVLPLFILGCAHSTGILPLGPDTFTVTERYSYYRGGGTKAQQVALTEANDFCATRNQKFMPVTNTSLQNSEGIVRGYEVVFRCLNPGDPELKRPNIARSPDVVIENRDR